MLYTVRLAHLEKYPEYKIGDIIKRGDIIGIMGTSGQSTAPHLHLDCAVDEQKKPYQLFDMDENGSIKPAPRQALFFIDDELFGIDPVITTPYAEFEYFQKRKKVHHGFDIVPIDRERWIKGVFTGSKEHYAIHWNRTNPGKVSLVVDDPKGYGYCIYIVFEA